MSETNSNIIQINQIKPAPQLIDNTSYNPFAPNQKRNKTNQVNCQNNYGEIKRPYLTKFKTKDQKMKVIITQTIIKNQVIRVNLHKILKSQKPIMKCQ